MSTSSKNKNKSQASRGNPSNYSQMYKSAASGAAAPTAAPIKAGAQSNRPLVVETPAARVKTSDDVDWGHEYAYVIGDLRRLGLVTLGLVVAIVVVGLFI